MTKSRIKIISQNQKILNQEGSLVISSYNLVTEMKKLSCVVTKIFTSGRGTKNYSETSEVLKYKKK